MLHYKFLCKALEVAETVVSIQPATWMNQQKNRAGLPLDGRGATINIIQDTEHLFGDSADLGYYLAVSVFSKKMKDVTIDWGAKDRTVYKDMTLVNPSDRYPGLRDIIVKGYQSDLSDGRTRLSHHIYGCGPGECAKGDHIITDPSVLKGKWIVALAALIPMRERRPNNFGVMNIDPNKPVVFQHDGSPDNRIGYCYCIFDTEREAVNCRNYLASDLVRAYSIAFKTDKHAVRHTAPHIPWPATFDTDPALWTNEAVSDRAGLDQKERDWLREMLPDCYNIRKPAVSHDTAG